LLRTLRVPSSAASWANFLEAVAPTTTAERKAEIQQQLLAYCQLDTLAMVRIWEFFTGRSSRR